MVAAAIVFETVPNLRTLLCISANRRSSSSGVDNQFVGDRRYEGRGVLPHAVQTNFDAAIFEMVHRRDALDAFDHAGGDGGEQQFGRIEGVVAAGDVVSRMISASLQRAVLPWESVRLATTS